MSLPEKHAAPGGGAILPAWNPRGGSDSPSARHPRRRLRCAKQDRGPPSLPSNRNALECLKVEFIKGGAGHF